MRKITIYLLLLFALQSRLAAQGQEVKGNVTDVSGHPLPGISVREKGSRNGTATNAEGIFSLSAPRGAMLIISGVGYEPKQVAVTGGGELAIQLMQDTKSLAEVVVTGVGVATSKRKVAIDVATVSSKDFAKSATSSIEQGIMGQIAGAQIQQTSGQPNSGFNIILRGVNSLSGTKPMILLDGVEVNSLSDIDPAIVDRVEVVKGSAAGMLYGAQGANGVIQLFSKKGAKGKMNIVVSSKSSWDKILRGHDITATRHHYATDAQGYVLDASGSRLKPNPVTGEWPAPNEDLSVNSKNDKVFVEPTYDHIAQSFRQAYTQTHSIMLSGGGDKSDYALTASYLDQQDVYSSQYKRFNLGINVGMELFKGFTLRSNTQMILSEDNTLADAGTRFGMINSYALINFLFRDSLGHLVSKPRTTDPVHNPLSEPEWHQRSSKPTRWVQNIDLNYKLPRFVTLDYKFGLDKTSTQGFDYYLNQTNSLQGDELPWGNTATGAITKSQESRTFINSLASVFVNTDFKNDFDWNIPLKTTTQFAYDYRKDEHFYQGTTGSGLPAYPPYNISVAQSTVGFDNSGTFTPGTFVSYGMLVNQSFDYGNLFGVSGGLRSDYSSEFGAASKPFTFYRGTAYFKPSEFLKNVVWLTDWKLRAAYGEAGIQPGRYQRQVTLTSTPLGAGVALSTPLTSANPDLRVQVSKELEGGTDLTLRPSLGAWFNKVFLSATYWKRRSIDVIQNADLAFSSGYANKTDNLSTFTSHGIDLTLDATILDTRDLVWNFGYRMGFAKSVVDDIANGKPVTAGPFSLIKGQEVGELFGQYAIRNINQLKPDGTPYISDASKKDYAAVNGIMVNTTTNAPLLSGANDLKAFGSVYPSFTAAFINSFTVKRYLVVSFQVDWYHGNKIYNISRQWLYRDHVSKDYDVPVTIGSQTGAFVNYYNGFYNTLSPVDWFAEDGSFLRLRNVSISYDLAGLIKAPWVKGAELTLSGRNLWTSSKYKGLDPENTSTVDAQGNDVSTSVAGFKGVDYFGVPNTRSYQLGLALHF